MAPGMRIKGHPPPPPFCFKPKAYLLQASSSLQFGSRGWLAFAMGGRVWLLDKKLQVPPRFPKRKIGLFGHTTFRWRKNDYLTYNGDANFPRGQK
jgi:hypothetical protein